MRAINTALLLLLARTAAAVTLPTHLHHLVQDAIHTQNPPKALPQHASQEQLRWQPALDFDTNGCYNSPAIDGNGQGL